MLKQLQQGYKETFCLETIDFLPIPAASHSFIAMNDNDFSLSQLLPLLDSMIKRSVRSDDKPKGAIVCSDAEK
jgi:hypothetical protein